VPQFTEHQTRQALDEAQERERTSVQTSCFEIESSSEHGTLVSIMIDIEASGDGTQR
jgi:hypothetical protein